MGADPISIAVMGSLAAVGTAGAAAAGAAPAAAMATGGAMATGAATAATAAAPAAAGGGFMAGLSALGGGIAAGVKEGAAAHPMVQAGKSAGTAVKAAAKGDLASAGYNTVKTLAQMPSGGGGTQERQRATLASMAQPVEYGNGRPGVAAPAPAPTAQFRPFSEHFAEAMQRYGL